MKIILDVMGGDKGPGVVIKGALDGRKALNIDIMLVGDENVIREEAEKQKQNKKNVRSKR